ncbi:MAG TPA: hypothetical protein VJ890_28360, partial [Vineibacter sp.]|nr:hypothetical protein [Vineibacter sp.]
AKHHNPGAVLAAVERFIRRAILKVLQPPGFLAERRSASLDIELLSIINPNLQEHSWIRGGRRGRDKPE